MSNIFKDASKFAVNTYKVVKMNELFVMYLIGRDNKFYTLS